MRIDSEWRSLPLESYPSDKRSRKEVSVPLSEHEERLLAQMEEALKAEDPRLVSTMTGDRQARGSLLLPALFIVAGFATLIGGLISQVAIVGVVGFALALAGLTWALRNFQRPKTATRGGAKGATKGRKKDGTRRSLTERMEERWDRPNE